MQARTICRLPKTQFFLIKDVQTKYLTVDLLIFHWIFLHKPRRNSDFFFLNKYHLTFWPRCLTFMKCNVIVFLVLYSLFYTYAPYDVWTIFFFLFCSGIILNMSLHVSVLLPHQFISSTLQHLHRVCVLPLSLIFRGGWVTLSKWIIFTLFWQNFRTKRIVVVRSPPLPLLDPPMVNTMSNWQCLNNADRTEMND
jgi:hypothetical protein